MILSKNKQFQFLVFAFLVAIVACKKDEVSNDFTLDRQFSVSNIRQTITETSVKFEWNPSLFSKPGKVKYTVQVAKDSLFAGTIDITKVVDSSGVLLKEGEIAILQNYFARVKANGVDGSADSKWITSSRFRITGEQLLLNVNAADITSTTVKLKWKIPSQVTHLTLGIVRYNISAQEAILGEKTITGLIPLTTYSVSLVAGTSLKGTKSFTTLSDLPTGPNVVNVSASDDLAALIQNAANGTIFVLLKGTKYVSDNVVNIPSGISFTIFGQNDLNKAVIAFNGLNLPANSGVIKFENLDFTGYQDNDPTKTKRSYIFNQSSANTTQEIIFENCILRNFANTPMRLQGSAPISIGKLTINKSIVFDIGDNNANGTYAVVHNSVATSTISNIVLTNSTFYKIGYSLVLHNLAPSISLTIDNNTFNNAVGNARYLVDYNVQAITNFSFKNNILGKTLSPANTARGIRYGGSSLSAENSFQTSDATITTNTITNISSYAQPSTSLFTSPDTGNFLIKDATFSGKSSAGDPRWRL